MDNTTLAVAIAIMRKLPGTASAQAAQVLSQAQTVLASIPADYTALSTAFDALGLYVDEDGYVCHKLEGE